MGYETIVDQEQSQSSGEKPEKTLYYTYTMPEDGLTENQRWIKKGESLEGYYLNSYVNPKSKFQSMCHVLVTKDNTHHVLKGATDIDKGFQNERVVEGVKTKFTYKGKQPFNYTDKKTGEVKEAKAMKCIIQQDKSDKVEFIGDKYSARITVGDSTPSQPAQAKAPAVNSDDVPF